MDLEKEYNVSCQDFNTHAGQPFWILDRNLNPVAIQVISEFLDPKNYFISVTRLKTHNIVIATMGLKNMAMGCPLNPVGAGGGRGGAGGGAGGMGGGGGMMGGGMGGGMMGGGRGARGPVQRPDKAARLASLKTLETQIATLKAAIDKAPDKDPNVATLQGDALTKFMDVYTPESEAVNAIQQTLAAMRGGAGGGRGGMGGASADVLSELRVLANGEKASKTVARIDALIKEAQNAPARGNRGGGMMGGGAGGPGGGGMMGGGAGAGAGAGRGGRGGA